MPLADGAIPHRAALVPDAVVGVTEGRQHHRRHRLAHALRVLRQRPHDIHAEPPPLPTHIGAGEAGRTVVMADAGQIPQALIEPVERRAFFDTLRQMEPADVRLLIARLAPTGGHRHEDAITIQARELALAGAELAAARNSLARLGLAEQQQYDAA
jgi:hypothetical protein